jgi:transposase InsO family protein
MNQDQRIRLNWIKLYEELGNAGLVCLRCGISRPTLRKWFKRYQTNGLEGLLSESKRPKSSPSQKVFELEKELILSMRKERNLGARRIQSELKRLKNISLSLATIHKVLTSNNVQDLKKTRRRHKKFVKRYSRKLPGDCIQMDVCKITNGCYQYTAIDDCTRYKVIELYSRRTATNTLNFIDHVIERMPFAFQRIQTDRGREIFAYTVQERLMEYGIKFRPVKPRSPHLNGKVERTQKTDLEEFYSIIDIKDPKLIEKLSEWEFYYNWFRPHSSLNGKTPWDKYIEKINETPLWEDIDSTYDISKERIIYQDYSFDKALQSLKGSL